MSLQVGEGGEGLNLHKCQSNLVIALDALSLLFCILIKTTAYYWADTSPHLPLAVMLPDEMQVKISTVEMHRTKMIFCVPSIPGQNVYFAARYLILLTASQLLSATGKQDKGEGSVSRKHDFSKFQATNLLTKVAKKVVDFWAI